MERQLKENANEIDFKTSSIGEYEEVINSLREKEKDMISTLNILEEESQKLVVQDAEKTEMINKLIGEGESKKGEILRLKDEVEMLKMEIENSNEEIMTSKNLILELQR